MKVLSKFEDIVDLAYFSHLDRIEQEETGTDLHERDRQLFLAAMEDGSLAQTTHLHCLRSWLDQRRAEARRDDLLPGAIIRRMLGFFQLALLVAGFLLGIILGGSYFAYGGQTALNVFSFLVIFLLPQLLLVVIVALRLFFATQVKNRIVGMRGLLMPLFLRFCRFSKRLSPSATTAGYNEDLRRFFRRDSAVLLQWPLFNRAQLFGLAFNAGLLILFLAKVTTTDLAFGWQTTLQLAPETLHVLLQILALPWSWCLPADMAHPSLEQIEGSRIILKDGIRHLQTNDLTSWWPFLFFSLLCYGLLPRALFFFLGVFIERRRRNSFLTQRRFHQISNRMLTPTVSTQGEPQREERREEVIVPEPGGDQHQLQQPGEKCSLLIPTDIMTELSAEKLQTLLRAHGYEPARKREIFASYGEDRRLLEELDGADHPIVILIEAWMAPIGEQLSFLEEIEKRAAQSASVTILLTGRPTPTSALPAPNLDEETLWRKKILQHCDSVTVLALASSAEDKLS